MHGDGYSPVAGRWLRNTSGNGPPGDLRRHRSLGSCPVPRQLGHEDAHFGRAADNLTEARRMAMSRIAASQNRQAESQELADVKKSGWGRPSSRSAPCSTKSPTWWAVLTRCTCMQSAQCRLLPRRRTATAATAAAPAETAATAPARLRTEGKGAPREAEAVSPAQALRIALVNRQTTKRKEVRRCKSCHSLRSAVQRLQKNHGALVEDFSQVPGNKV